MENFRDYEILKPYMTEGKDDISNDFFYGEGELSEEMEIKFPFTSGDHLRRDSKCVEFIMSVHFAEVIHIFFCIIIDIPIMRTPLQILFLILVTDLQWRKFQGTFWKTCQDL